MNTDKILAEAIAKDYVPKDNSKIIALKKLDSKAKLPATIFTYTFGITAISFEWVKEGCKKPIDEISKIIVECIFGLNNADQSKRIGEELFG